MTRFKSVIHTGDCIEAEAAASEPLDVLTLTERIWRQVEQGGTIRVSDKSEAAGLASAIFHDIRIVAPEDTA